MEDSFDLINSGTKPLAAYMFTNNKKLKEKFVEKVSAGGLVINDTTVHVSILRTFGINVAMCVLDKLHLHAFTFKSGDNLHG